MNFKVLYIESNKKFHLIFLSYLFRIFLQNDYLQLWRRGDYLPRLPSKKNLSKIELINFSLQTDQVKTQRESILHLNKNTVYQQRKRTFRFSMYVSIQHSLRETLSSWTLNEELKRKKHCKAWKHAYQKYQNVVHNCD